MRRWCLGLILLWDDLPLAAQRSNFREPSSATRPSGKNLGTARFSGHAVAMEASVENIVSDFYDAADSRGGLEALLIALERYKQRVTKDWRVAKRIAIAYIVMAALMGVLLASAAGADHLLDTDMWWTTLASDAITTVILTQILAADAWFFKATGYRQIFAVVVVALCVTLLSLGRVYRSVIPYAASSAISFVGVNVHLYLDLRQGEEAEKEIDAAVCCW